MWKCTIVKTMSCVNWVPILIGDLNHITLSLVITFFFQSLSSAPLISSLSFLTFLTTHKVQVHDCENDEFCELRSHIDMRPQSHHPESSDHVFLIVTFLYPPHFFTFIPDFPHQSFLILLFRLNHHSWKLNCVRSISRHISASLLTFWVILSSYFVCCRSLPPSYVIISHSLFQTVSLSFTLKAWGHDVLHTHHVNRLWPHQSVPVPSQDSSSCHNFNHTTPLDSQHLLTWERHMQIQWEWVQIDTQTHTDRGRHRDWESWSEMMRVKQTIHTSCFIDDALLELLN